ncbi:MAG: hypothetical protein EA379_03425 [Phycisphaerales bacterium]|nr:MAG: hypothetical protein EA379_03425 [Phycisphaerales bacterium]
MLGGRGGGVRAGGYTGSMRRHDADPDASTPPGERVRSAVEHWLNWALTLPESRFPRIPLRRVSEGGFDDLLARPHGRRVAARWWARALDNDDLDYDPTPAPRRARRAPVRRDDH